MFGFLFCLKCYMSLRGCRDAPLFLFDGYLIALLENNADGEDKQRIEI